MDFVKPQLDFYGSAPIPRLDWREQAESLIDMLISFRITSE
jgi:hypothetical protein